MSERVQRLRGGESGPGQLKAKVLEIIGWYEAEALSAFERHEKNIADYVARKDWHGVWDFAMEVQQAKDVMLVLQQLRADIEALKEQGPGA